MKLSRRRSIKTLVPICALGLLTSIVHAITYLDTSLSSPLTLDTQQSYFFSSDLRQNGDELSLELSGLSGGSSSIVNFYADGELYASLKVDEQLQPHHLDLSSLSSDLEMKVAQGQVVLSGVAVSPVATQSQSSSAQSWEVGSIVVTDQWQTIYPAHAYADPVLLTSAYQVVGGSVQSAGTLLSGAIEKRQGAAGNWQVRVKPWVGMTSFNASIDYVIADTQVLQNNDLALMVATFDKSASDFWYQWQFDEAYPEGMNWHTAPSVVAQSQTQNDSRTLMSKIKNLDFSGFWSALFASDSLNNEATASERMGVLAVSALEGATLTSGEQSWPVSTSTFDVQERWKRLGDWEYRLVEDTSEDDEQDHTAETVNVITIGDVQLAQIVTNNGVDNVGVERRLHSSVDADLDGIRDEEDDDIDNDGILNAQDAYPYDASRSQVATVVLPAAINAVDYLDAQDSDAGSSTYRGDDGVDINDDATVGLHISRITQGEWLRYSVEVAKAGYYRFDLLLGAENASSLMLTAGERSEELPFQTGADRNFVTFSLPPVYLAAGQQTVKIEALSGGFRFARLTAVMEAPSLSPLMELKFEDSSNLTLDSSSYARTDIEQVGEFGQPILRTGRGVQFENDKAQKVVWRDALALHDFSMSVQLTEPKASEHKLTLVLLNDTRGSVMLEKTQAERLRLLVKVKDQDGHEVERTSWVFGNGESMSGYLTYTYAVTSSDNVSLIGHLSLYVDGEPVLSAEQVRFPYFTQPNLVLGNGTASLTEVFNSGTMVLDEWRLDGHAVTAAQAKVLYQQSAAPDSDGDGHIDIVDAFPNDPHEFQDSDQDGIGNNADTDDDNDGTLDSLDAFPLDANESLDSDGDGIGNNADTDDDNDGVLDANDAYPTDAKHSESVTVSVEVDDIGVSLTSNVVFSSGSERYTLAVPFGELKNITLPAQVYSVYAQPVSGLQAFRTPKQLDASDASVAPAPISVFYRQTPNISKLQQKALPGIEVELLKTGLANIRQMAMGNGVLFAATRTADMIYAMSFDNDTLAIGDPVVIASGLNMPSGITYKDGTLYIADIDGVYAIENADSGLTKRPTLTPILTLAGSELDTSDRSSWTSQLHHQWKFIRFSPNPEDKGLYIPIGLPCDHCNGPDARFGTILRYDLETGSYETVARGIRNSVGFDFHPTTGELWFSDNGRQIQGLPDELNVVTTEGEHFGAPYVFGHDWLGITEEEEAAGESLDIARKDIRVENYSAPALEIAPHSAPLGIEFANLLPSSYGATQLWIAQHGVGMADKEGLNIQLVGMNDGQIDYVIDAVPYLNQFMDNWSDYLCFKGQCNGRPVAFVELPDGSLLVSDDSQDSIIRLSQSDNAALGTSITITPPALPDASLSTERVELQLTDPLGYTRNISLRFGGKALVLPNMVYGEYELTVKDFNYYLAGLNIDATQSLSSSSESISWTIDYQESTATSGKLTLKTPVSPSFSVANERQSVTITGENYQSTETLDWNSEVTLESLVFGDYEVVVSSVGGYEPSPSSQKVSLTGREPEKSLNWTMQANSTTGQSLFTANCAGCHSASGVGVDLLNDSSVKASWNEKSLALLNAKVDTMPVVACDSLCRSKVSSYLWYDVWGNTTETPLKPGKITINLSALESSANDKTATFEINGDNVKKSVSVTEGSALTVIDLPLQDYTVTFVDSVGVVEPMGRQVRLTETQVESVIEFKLQYADSTDLDNDGLADYRDDDIDGDGISNEDDSLPTNNLKGDSSLLIHVPFEVNRMELFNTATWQEIGDPRLDAPSGVTATIHNPTFVDGVIGDAQHSDDRWDMDIVGLGAHVSDGFTVSYWLNSTDNWTNNNYMGPGWGKFQTFYDDAGTLTIGVRSGEAIKVPIPQNGKWYHLAYTYENGTQKLYINGELKSEGTVVKLPTEPWTTFKIRSVQKTSMDDFRVYNRMLSADQVSRLFKLTQNVMTPDLDGDGIADEIDWDRDGDGVYNQDDWAPDNSKEWLDSDNDGIGNNADNDDDNDGVLDAFDGYPLDPLRSTLPIKVEVDPNEATIVDLNTRVLQAACIKCHTSEGAAATSRLHLETGLSELVAQLNGDILNSYINDYDSEIDVILGKPSGRLNHGGGTVYAEHTNEWQILRAVLYKSFSKEIPQENSPNEYFSIESKDRTYRKASLLLTGKVPNSGVLTQAKTWTEAQLAENILALMDKNEAGFKQFVKNAANDKMLVRELNHYSYYRLAREVNGKYYWRYPKSLEVFTSEGSDYTHDHGNEFGQELIEAPLELVWHVVSEDKPYSEILTADYTMGSKVTADMFAGVGNLTEGEYVPVVDKNYHVTTDGKGPKNSEGTNKQIWNDTMTPLPRPHVGVLSTYGYLWSKPNTDSNYHRTRANETLKIFLNYDIETNLARTISTDDVSTEANPTMDNPACANCHITMDPIAAGFQDYGHSGEYKYRDGKNALTSSYVDSILFRDGDTWYSDIRSAGYYGVETPDKVEPLEWLSEKLIQDRRFATGTVNFWWPAIFSREMMKAPEPSNTDYETLLALYQYEQKLVELWADNFVANNMSLKGLLQDMLTSHYFRSVSKNEDSLVGMSSLRFLTPEELVNKFESLTGYSFNTNGTWNGQNRFSLPDYMIGLGGIDSVVVKERTRDITPIGYGLLSNQAIEASCTIIVNEFKTGNVNLFSKISENDILGRYLDTYVPINDQVGIDTTVTHSFLAGGGSQTIEYRVKEGGAYINRISLTNSQGESVLSGTPQELSNQGLLSHTFGDFRGDGSMHTWSTWTRYIRIAYTSPKEDTYTLRVELEPLKEVYKGYLKVTQDSSKEATGPAKSKVMNQLIFLAERLWGVTLASNSQTMQTLFELYADGMDSRKTSSDGYDLNRDGRCAYDIHGNGQTSNSDLFSDPNNTLNAWQLILTSMLMDYRFSHE